MHNRTWVPITIFCIAQILTRGNLFAETVILRSGEAIKGKITKITDKLIRIEENGIPMTYFRDELCRIIEATGNIPDPELDAAASAVAKSLGERPACPEGNFEIWKIELNGDKGSASVTALSGPQVKRISLEKNRNGWKGIVIPLKYDHQQPGH